MNTFLCVDCENIVLEYLPADDIFKVQDVLSWGAAEFVDKLLVKRVHDTLLKKGFPEEFLTAFEKDNNDCVITGSTILEAIYGEEYKNSDIDIFTEKDNKHYISVKHNDNFISSILKKATYKFSGYPYKYGNIYAVWHILPHAKDDGKLKNGIHETQLGSKGEIQLITIDLVAACFESIDDYIAECFDFDFVKNFYDGKKVIILDRTAVRDKKNFSVIYGDVKWNACRIEQIYNIHIRLEKYIDRGFQFPNYKPPEYLGRITQAELKNYIRILSKLVPDVHWIEEVNVIKSKLNKNGTKDVDESVKSKYLPISINYDLR